MKAIAQRRETATLESLLDRVLCHDVRDGAGKVAVAKGARLTSKAAETLLATPWEEIHLLALEPGDLHEEEGGRRLGAAAVGEGVEVKGYGGGQWTLTANRRGLLKIRRGPLADANALEGISIFTLFDGQPVEPGETVAKCKVTPLVIAETTIRAIDKTARARSTRSTPCSADSRCSALAWSATALRRIPAASCGSPSGTASPSSACPRVGCSLRRRRSTSCFHRSWRVSTWTTGRSPSSATAACSRATWPTASRPIGRTLRVGSSNERHAGGAGTLQRCHPGAMASAALPRRAAGSRCGRRGRQPALRRPRAADAGARGRARQRGPVRGRLVRDLRGVGRRARRARRRALARRRPEGGGRGPAGGAPGGHSSHADALRDAPALGARDRVEREAMRPDELTRPDFPILERAGKGQPVVA